MKVKFIKELYPYREWQVIDMPDHLAEWQNAEYVTKAGKDDEYTDFSMKATQVIVEKTEEKIEEKKPEIENNPVDIVLDENWLPIEEKKPEIENDKNSEESIASNHPNKSMAEKSKTSK